MRVSSSIFILYNIIMSAEAWAPRPMGERELISNYSNMALRKVPRDVTPATTTLDLSYNLLYQFQSSDFYSFSELRFLILCHNRLRQLDTTLFDRNKELSYLDLSYNRLKSIVWSSLANLRHLDLSFNDFDTLPAFEEMGNTPHLETLGLSGSKIQRSDLQKIAHLHLSAVLLGLSTLSHYEEGSLPVLNTTKLHIILPTNTHFWVLLCDGIKTSKVVEMSGIDGKSQFISYETLQTLSVEDTKASTLIFHKADLLWDDLLLIFQFVWRTSVEYFQIRDLTFGGMGNGDHSSFDYSNTVMKAIILENIHFRIFFIPQDRIYLFFTQMDLENLTISDAQMLHLLFPSHPQSFQHLNFANNILTDDLFKSPIQLPCLKTLILRGNKLETLSLVSLFANHTSLLRLDLSQNLLQHANGENCTWPDTLVLLNLSSNKFDGSVFRCLPKSIQTLDLNNNKIRAVPKEITRLKSLRELSIAFNLLTDLPGCGHFEQLSFLNIEMNLILNPSLNFFQSCQEVKTLIAGRNPFQCTCELRDFLSLQKHSKGLMAGWPDSYSCEYPLNLKGTPLNDVYLPELACNTTLLIVTIVLVLLVLGLVVAFCSLCFDMPWYLRMLGQCILTQHRVRKIVREESKRGVQFHQFHAFISYAAHDSVWVKNELIPNLETEDGSVLLCLPERDFDPDRSIAENIISCTESSYQSIFVLSPSFVQDGWCHYEFYLAHHNPSYNSVIPILREPIPSYCVPTRFPKLRDILEKNVYLEWPKDKCKCKLFLANLRAAINVNLSDTRGRCELRTFTEPNEE